MSERPAQHTAFLRRTLQICGVLALVGASSGLAAAPTPASGPAVAQMESRDWMDWLEYMIFQRRLQYILGDGEPLPGSGEATQAAAAAIAADQIALYAQSGLIPSPTPAEVAQALSDIATLRSTILLNPTEFSDPVWDDYLDALQAMKAELES